MQASKLEINEIRSSDFSTIVYCFVENILREEIFIQNNFLI